MRLRLRPLPIRARLTLWYTGVLLGILLAVSALSYVLLHWSLTQDLDASLLTVAQIIRDTGYPGAGVALGPGPEEALREILGPEFSDKFFQFFDPQGRPGSHSAHLRNRPLPLSTRALENAAHGVRTFETMPLAGGEPVRVLTMPIIRDGRLTQVVQVGIPLERLHQTLRRYLETLFVLIPLGVGLAGVGGALTARAALAPVNEMSRSARRITAEDLALRVTLRGTGDELDHLAGTLNAMLARLEDAFTQTRGFAATRHTSCGRR